MREISSFFLSSLQLLLLCSDQKVWFRSNRARSPASTPSALLHRGREDHLSSQCVHLLPILLSLHPPPSSSDPASPSSSPCLLHFFFFMFSFCQASTCLPVLLCDLKCSEDAFVILKIWSKNIKYSISELLRPTDCALAHINFISGHEEMYVSTANASLDPPDTAQSKWAFQFCSSNSCMKG